MSLEEAVLSAVIDAVFGCAFDKGFEGWKEEQGARKAFKKALNTASEQFQRQEPQWYDGLFDASFFQHEGKYVLAEFLLRDGRPDATVLAEAWVHSLSIRQPERRRLYVRELEPVAANFLDLFAQQLKKQPALRQLHDSRAFEQLASDLQALRTKLGAEKATRGTYRDYLQWLVDRNLYIDSRGTYQTQRQVQVRLDEVYVSLKAQLDISPGTIDKAFLEAAEGGPSSKRRQRAAGDSLDRNTSAEDVEERLELAHIASSQALLPKRVAEVLELGIAVTRHSHLVVLGDPGSGKTTLLRYLALLHAQALLQEQQEAAKDLGKARFPLYIRIAEYAEDGNWKKHALSAFLANGCTIHECPKSGLEDLLLAELEKGECLVLLDGLDEIVSADERRSVVQRIEDFVRRYEHKGNRFLVTSRIAGYRTAPLAAPFTHYTVQDMDDPQMQRFLERWCRAVEDTQTPDLSPQERAATAQREIDGILKAIRGAPGVRRLAANPLLLRILALIHRTGARLPQKRVELYRLAADTLSRTWRPAQGVPESALVKEEYLTPLLSSLAYWLHEHKPTGIATEREVYEVLGEKWADINDLDWDVDRPNPKINEEIKKFLEAVREHTGLFVERAPKRYGFMHLTFEEYYAARHLVERSKTRAKLIRQHLHDPRWEEPILLALGFVGLDYPKEASELLETAILARGEDAKILGLTASPYESLLGRDFLFAIRCLGDNIPVRARLHKELIERLVGQLLQQKDLARFERYRAMLQTRLEQLVGSETADLLCPLLCTALHDPNDSVRRQAAESLGQLASPSPEALAALLSALQDHNYTERYKIATILEQFAASSSEVLAALIATLHDPDSSVRCNAAASLTGFASLPEVLSALLAALHDPDSSVRSNATFGLSSLDTPSSEVLSALLAALHDPDSSVRLYVAANLSRHAALSPEALSVLLACLHDDPESFLRLQAVRPLSQFASSPEILDALLTALHDPNPDVRSNVAKNLGQLASSSPEILDALLTALHDPNPDVRSNVAENLGQLASSSPEILDALLTALHDPNPDVRGRAAGSLGQLASPSLEVLAALVVALHDPDTSVRFHAATSLANLGSTESEVVITLLEALQVENWVIRRDAANILGKIEVEDSAAIQTSLWQGLLDEDNDVTDACSKALAQLARRYTPAQRKRFEARLVRALDSKKFSEHYNSVYGVLWLLVIGEDEEQDE